MRVIRGLLLVLALLSPLPAQAHHNPNRFGYEEATLRYWQGRYADSMPRMLDALLTYGATPAQRARLTDVRFSLPLSQAELPAAYRTGVYEPMVYFVDGQSKTIYLSVTSILFLDELSKAYAWLFAQECSPEPLADFMAMLKYRTQDSFAGGHYPTPLAALGVPADVFDEDDPVETPAGTQALAFFNQARAFLIAHELGHLYHRHLGNLNVTRRQSQADERQADEFAANLLANAGVVPVGMFLFFFSWAHYAPNRWDFATQAEWEAALAGHTHPLTVDRLATIAETLTRRSGDYPAADRAAVRQVAREMTQLVDFLSDEENQTDLQQSFRITGATVTLESLAASCASTPPPSPATEVFAGRYEGTHLRHTAQGAEELAARWAFRRQGNRVTGTFDFGLGPGTLTGEIEGNTLYFAWKWAWTDGRGRLEASADGSQFSGTWGYWFSDDNGGVWRGKRR
jgi:hypothetical protein